MYVQHPRQLKDLIDDIYVLLLLSALIVFPILPLQLSIAFVDLVHICCES